MGIRRYHLDRQSIFKGLINPKSIQFGFFEWSIPFVAAGPENFTTDVTFPTPFEAEPSIILCSTNNANVQAVASAKTATGFTCQACDVGVDQTASLTVTVYWMAVE